MTNHVVLALKRIAQKLENQFDDGERSAVFDLQDMIYVLHEVADEFRNIENQAELAKSLAN